MMTLSESIIADLAEQLYQARRTRIQLRQFSRQYPQMTIEDAYAIQRRWVQRELADGRAVKGRKIGLTSRAMQQASQITDCATSGG
jgi:2-oxo-hept-3-ene-1,7-dioate hydratase